MANEVNEYKISGLYVLEGGEAGSLFAFGGAKAGRFLCVAAVGRDLQGGSHSCVLSKKKTGESAGPTATIAHAWANSCSDK
jgi:hypothetical protein